MTIVGFFYIEDRVQGRLVINLFSRPRQSQGLLYKHLRDSLINSVFLFLSQLYAAATPKRLEIAL